MEQSGSKPSSRRKDLETWEPWQVSRLQLYWEDGRTSTEIAQILNKTRGAIMGKIYRLGLTKKNTRANQYGTFSKNLVTTPPTSSEEKSAPQITGVDRKIG